MSLVLHIAIVLRFVINPTYGDGLVHQKHFADYFPFSRPEKSYTVHLQTQTLRLNSELLLIVEKLKIMQMKLFLQFCLMISDVSN